MLTEFFPGIKIMKQRKGAVRYMIKTYVIDTNVLIQAPYAIE